MNSKRVSQNCFVLFTFIILFLSFDVSALAAGDSAVEGSINGICPHCIQKVLKIQSDTELLIRHYREEITRLMKALNDLQIANNHEVGYWMNEAIKCASKLMGKCK